MLSCKEATKLMEINHHQPLRFGQRMNLFFHTMMCSACRRYEKQSEILEKLFKGKKSGIVETDLEQQTEKLKEKILNGLKD